MSKQTTMQIEKRKKEKCTWNGTCQTFDYCKDTCCTKKHNNKLVQNTKNQTCNIIAYQTCNVIEKMKISSQQASLRRRQRGTHKCQWG
jgi:hypothetical protein